MSSCDQQSTSDSKRRRFADELQALGLSDHDLTKSLLKEVESFSRGSELKSIVSVHPTCNARIKVLLSPPEDYAYSGHTWHVEVGGPGIGLDYDFGDTCQVSTVDARAPVSVRFCEPISHYHCDDCGQVDMEFWRGFEGLTKGGGSAPGVSLENICIRLLMLLREPLVDASGKLY